MPERIFITYTNATAIPYQGTTLAHHAVLNYIDSKGRHFTLEGMPEHKFNRNVEKMLAVAQEEAFSNGEKNTDSRFGRLRARPDIVKSNGAATEPHTMIAEGGDLSSAWAKMVRFGEEVNSTGYEYRPSSQNSNSFAAAALRRAGFFGPGKAFPEFSDRLLAVDPVSGKSRPVFVTGFDQRLINPLNKPATQATSVQELEMPLAPTNGNSDHRRQNVFDGRFGVWVAPPGGNLNQPVPSLLTGRPAVAGGKPVRYLSRRIAGKPEASAFDAGALAVPFVPTNDFMSPDPRTSFEGRFGDRASSGVNGGLGERTSHPLSPDAPGSLGGRLSAPASIDPARPIGTPHTFDAATSSNRRYLTRRIAGQPHASVFETGAPPVPLAPTNGFLSPDTEVSLSDRFGDRTSSIYGRSSAIDPFSADTPGGLAGRLAALAGIDPVNPDPRVLTLPENRFYNDEQPQHWLFRGLTGRPR